MRDAHRTVYRRGLSVKDAMAELAEARAAHPEVEAFAASIESSEWGIIRGRGSAKD